MLLRFMLVQFIIHSICDAAYVKVKPAAMLRALADATQHDLENAVQIAEDQIEKLATFERNIHGSGLKTEKESPFYGLMVDFMASEEALNNTKNALAAIKASQYLVSKYCLRNAARKKAQCVKQLSSIKLPGSLGKACARVYGHTECDAELAFRSADGVCNNLGSSSWGRSNTGYRRLLQPDYDDGIHSMRKFSVDGKELPSPRVVSTAVSETQKFIELEKTQAMSAWGLFIGYDMAHTPASNMEDARISCGLGPEKILEGYTLSRSIFVKNRGNFQVFGGGDALIPVLMDIPKFGGHKHSRTPLKNDVNVRTPITCCTGDGGPLPPRFNHLSCAPIAIPQTDVFYNQFYQTCMNYVRSLPSLNSECTFGPTEQMNQATHFLDGSVIYGSTERKTKTLRAMWGGRLLTSLTKNGEEYPPVSDDSEVPCHLTNVSKCYHAGDARINSHPQVSILHTLFVREHNRIADRLAGINEEWDDERLFQESRRIVIAEIQHITFSHWLPRVLGKKYMVGRGLDSPHPSSRYDETLDPTVSNSFAVAGLPFVNSMIDGNIGLYTEDRNVTEVTDLKQYFAKNSAGYNRTLYVDGIVRGLATQSSHKIDNTFEDALMHYWYSPSGAFGMDLFSIDIQRGRDHGIPAYVSFRKYCNLSDVTSFKDLKGIISETTIDRLESVYERVEDVDLFVGVVSELPVKDAMIGPTLQCILGEQFFKTKYGDRHFYDHQLGAGSFSKKQLEQIRRASLARILCDNSHEVMRMQRDVFIVPDKNSNRLLTCSETNIPFINLNTWNDNAENS